MLRTCFAVCAFALILVFDAPGARAEEPTVGKPHPEVRLPTIDGESTVSLDALRGSKVLLIQFASW